MTQLNVYDVYVFLYFKFYTYTFLVLFVQVYCKMVENIYDSRCQKEKKLNIEIDVKWRTILFDVCCYIFGERD